MDEFEVLLTSVSPASILDVGCGCGKNTNHLLRFCNHVTGIDNELAMAPRWARLSLSSPVRYCCMDARAMGFADGTFDLALERAALHHVAEWQHMLEEMLRVSAKSILIDEQIDDLRSPAKRWTYEAQGLMLELQLEIGYRHYRHLDRDELLSFVKSRANPVAIRVERKDKPVTVQEFSESFELFAKQSKRKNYWQNRLTAFLLASGDAELCEDDRLIILAEKKGQP